MIALAPDYFNDISAKEYQTEYDKFCNHILPSIHSCPCPLCKSYGRLIKWGRYIKKTTIIDTDNPSHEEEVKIQRMRCKDCKRTFSILPDFFIPRCKFTVLDMYKILQDHFSGKRKIEELVDSISTRSIHRYVDRFVKWKEHFNSPDILSLTISKLRNSFTTKSASFLSVPMSSHINTNTECMGNPLSKCESSSKEEKHALSDIRPARIT